ncbi:hypothetical protein AB0F81_32330 [Actinoplanes sp. NPDC024001]|uniref:hypothetical protein n=1 Tax=Actinoplanes sp. NPDC024001 TaxID=3154598 RepID=UPI0033D3E411
MSAETQPAQARVADGTAGGGRRSWLNDFFRAASPGETLPEQSCQVEEREPLRLLAQGDAFCFEVHVAYRWRGHAADREQLRTHAEYLMPRARRFVTHWLRPIARSYPPHRAHVLEEDVNQRFNDYWCPLHDGDQQLRFSFTGRVEPEEAVRQQMRPYWQARIKAECDHELGLQRAQLADELTRRWSEVFERLQRDPRAAHVAALSEERFATVFGAFVDSRRKDVDELVTLLRDAVKGHHDSGLGPSEYTRAWDAALKAFEQRHGVDRP